LKKLTVTAAAVLLSIMLAASLIQAKEPAKAKTPAKAKAKQAAVTKEEAISPGARVVAKVGPESITEADVLAVMGKAMPGRPPTDDAKEMVLRKMVEVYAMAQDARKAGLEKDPEVRKRLDDAIKITLAQSYLEYMRRTKSISDAKAKKYFEGHREDFLRPEQYRLQHILLKDEETAKKVLAQLKEGAITFEKLAEKESQDQMTAKRGGDLDWRSAGELDDDFEKAAFALKKGEVGDVVKTPFGWHIIKLSDFREKKPMTFEEAKEGIKQWMVSEQERNIRSGIFDRADVKLFLPEKKAAKTPTLPKGMMPPAVTPGAKPEGAPETAPPPETPHQGAPGEGAPSEGAPEAGSK
jgi:hypothetical protein